MQARRRRQGGAAATPCCASALNRANSSFPAPTPSTHLQYAAALAERVPLAVLRLQRRALRTVVRRRRRRRAALLAAPLAATHGGRRAVRRAAALAAIRLGCPHGNLVCGRDKGLR